MPRGKKIHEIDGQLCLFDFCTDASNYVVQANNLIGGRQALKLNSAKLIRSAIMQVVREDRELKPYIITIKEFAQLLQIDESNVYRYADEITDDILKNPVYVKEEKQGKFVKWIKIPWVSKCEYNSDMGIALKLNDELKPFLINLREHYTQYTLESVLAMKSVYAIRIYELLQSRIMSQILPKDGINIIISVEELKECCDCIDKYVEFSNFRIKVLDKAKSEINRVTMFRIDYSYIKKGRSVVNIDFHINMCYH
ncbi:MAG: replication initiation protein [Lachnospiraceae bacterium]|nr:replication initiation protein [Lachnospiraceae bacterium]